MLFPDYELNMIINSFIRDIMEAERLASLERGHPVVFELKQDNIFLKLDSDPLQHLFHIYIPILHEADINNILKL